VNRINGLCTGRSPPPLVRTMAGSFGEVDRAGANAAPGEDGERKMRSSQPAQTHTRADRRRVNHIACWAVRRSVAHSTQGVCLSRSAAATVLIHAGQYPTGTCTPQMAIIVR
jgi:hypothetical protein